MRKIFIALAAAVLVSVGNAVTVQTQIKAHSLVRQQTASLGPAAPSQGPVTAAPS